MRKGIKPLFRLAYKLALANFRVLPFPFKLTYVATKECHSRCVNCHIWHSPPRNELALGEVTQLARNSPGLSWVDFTGGEPTDRADFPEIVGAFVANCPDLLFVHFPTNGLRPEHIAAQCEKIIRYDPPSLVVTISIDGPPEVNDRLRGVKGDFTLAIETYHRLKALPGLEAHIGMTLYPQNIDCVDQTVAALAERIPGFCHRDLHINLPHLSSHYYGNQSVEKQLTDGFKKNSAIVVERFMRQRGMPRSPLAFVERLYHGKVAEYLQTGVCPQACSALQAQAFLAEDGTLYPCSIWDEPLGNIRDWGYSLQPGLASPQAAILKQRLCNKDCPNCWTPCEAFPTLASNVMHGFWRHSQ